MHFFSGQGNNCPTIRLGVVTARGGYDCLAFRLARPISAWGSLAADRKLNWYGDHWPGRHRDRCLIWHRGGHRAPGSCSGSPPGLGGPAARSTGPPGEERPGALAGPTDVTDASALPQLRDRALEEFGSIDVPMNYAGQGLLVPLSAVDPEDFQAVWKLNVLAPLALMQAVLPAMTRRGRRLQREHRLRDLPDGSPRAGEPTLRPSRRSTCSPRWRTQSSLRPEWSSRLYVQESLSQRSMTRLQPVPSRPERLVARQRRPRWWPR